MTSNSELELVLCYTRPSLRKPPTENVDRLACEAAQNGDGALPHPEPSIAHLASSLLTERNKLRQCPGYVPPSGPSVDIITLVSLKCLRGT